jgi:hypothetical protein
MFVDHKCLYLPDPDPINNAQCRDPKTSVVEVTPAKLEGTWYVNYGFNPDYDCFACQELSFAFNNTDAHKPIWYNAYYDIINVKGNLQWNDVVMTGTQSTPGILSLSGQNNGFDNNQEWYITALDENVLMAYYCGTLMTWKFEGLLIMTKSKTISTEEIQSLERVMFGMDFKLSDLCKLNPS